MTSDTTMEQAQPTIPERFASAFAEARALQSQGRLGGAMEAYQELLRLGAPREPALRGIVEIAVRAGQVDTAISALVELTGEVPDRIFYFARLAALLEGMGEVDAAIEHYQRLLATRPDLADAHFNVALLYKKARRTREAVDAYQAAIRLGIGRAEEAYSNLGVLHAELRDGKTAEAMYARALEINPDYVPALFNLAGLREELGEREGAISLYRRVLELNPTHWASLSRLAYIARVSAGDDTLVTRLQRGMASTEEESIQRESLYFALGKVLDDQGRHDEAFRAYELGNELGRRRHAPHDRDAVTRRFDRIMALFNREWIAERETDLGARPIFICGMFRSGSTLVERVLAAHPEVTAGGELDLMTWLIEREAGSFPVEAVTAGREDLERLGRDYCTRVADLFPNSRNVTDKQPVNFEYLGLIRAVFPQARFVYTHRGLADNCLSVYFQQLDASLTYANDLGDIAHYYREQERLMAHWQACLGESLHQVSYEQLVRDPASEVRALLDFLALPWDARCLDFAASRGQVGTASLWQVREPLHDRSIGRWTSYARQLARSGISGEAGG